MPSLPCTTAITAELQPSFGRTEALKSNEPSGLTSAVPRNVCEPAETLMLTALPGGKADPDTPLEVGRLGRPGVSFPASTTRVGMVESSPTKAAASGKPRDIARGRDRVESRPRGSAAEPTADGAASTFRQA